ncbi:M6 family metalloprotease domain-containing protein [Bacteroidales bacterium OttesenSCG-928-C19]|nr:M6 family metalloprotease domain-containing protein [Bacteroidales bacterium OttesenSCG-928-C19]
MKKSIFLFILIAFLSTITRAVPADPSLRRATTKDGRSLTYICIGDEFLQTYRTIDGYTIIQTEESGWVYAILNSENELVPSNFIACNENERTVEEISFLASTSKNLSFKREQVTTQIENRTKSRSSYTKSSKSMNTFPTEGKVNLLIILVDFPDVKMTYTQEQFQDFATGENYQGNGNNEFTRNPKFGSIRNYYLENSNGRLDMQIDVVGPYTVSKNRAEYGKNTYDWQGNRRSDKNTEGMANEAIKLAMNDGVDFSKYDNDNNDTIDAIHFIFSGHSEASTGKDEDIWPMRSNLINRSRPTPSGKTTSIYSISSEYQGETNYMGGVGVTCHELTHVLGLPDWYDTDESDGKNYVMGKYSLMDGGPYVNNENTPPHLNAVEKEMLNWHNHIELDTAGTYTLPVWNTSENAISYKLTTPVEHEYYILENRQQAGWDVKLPGHGLLIYHVDQKMVNVWYEGPSAIMNSINARKDSMGFYLICADNRRVDNSTSMAGDPFPGTANNTSFTDESTPAVRLRYTKAPLNKPITKITELGDTAIQFVFNYNTVSIPTGVVCSENIDEIAPLVAGTYDENDTYLWQVLKNNTWSDAPGENTNSEYYLTEYEEGAKYRRIIISSEAGSDTSIAYALPKYEPSVGGTITPSFDSIFKGESVRLVLDDYIKDITQWQVKDDESSEWISIRNTTATLLQAHDVVGDYTYRAVVRNKKCPEVYSSEAVVIVSPEPEEPIAELDEYLVYPSPSNGLINIHSSTDDLYDVSIFNSVGKLVYSRNDIQLRTETVNLPYLQSGVYIVQIKNKQDDSIHNKKIVISKFK